jgi:hypothetical protein
MKNVDLKNETPTFGNVLLAAVKNGRIKEWFYEWKHGHPFLLNEEVEIICETRAEERYKWMNDEQIQGLIKARVKAMYRKKYPNAKRWSLAHF